MEYFKDNNISYIKSVSNKLSNITSSFNFILQEIKMATKDSVFYLEQDLMPYHYIILCELGYKIILIDRLNQPLTSQMEMNVLNYIYNNISSINKFKCSIEINNEIKFTSVHNLKKIEKFISQLKKSCNDEIVNLYSKLEENELEIRGQIINSVLSSEKECVIRTRADLKHIYDGVFEKLRNEKFLIREFEIPNSVGIKDTVKFVISW